MLPGTHFALALAQLTQALLAVVGVCKPMSEVGLPWCMFAMLGDVGGPFPLHLKNIMLYGTDRIPHSWTALLKGKERRSSWWAVGGYGQMTNLARITCHEPLLHFPSFSVEQVVLLWIFELESSYLLLIMTPMDNNQSMIKWGRTRCIPRITRSYAPDAIQQPTHKNILQWPLPFI